MTRFAIDTFSVQSTDMASAVTLRAIGQATHRLRKSTAGPNSGNTYDEERFILDVGDEFELGSVLALKSLLGFVSPLTGKCVAKDVTHFGLRLFGASLNACGTNGRGAGGTHLQATAIKSRIFLTSLGGSKNQFASANLRIVNVLETGETTPTVTVFNASLPSTFVANEAFKIGPVQLGGVALTEDETASVDIQTGIDLQVVMDLTTGFPKEVLVLKSQPTIRISMDAANTNNAAIIPYTGKACTHANSFVTFIALDPAGTITPLATAAHIKVTFAGKAFVEDAISGGGPQSAGSTIVVETKEASGGSSAPLVVTLDTALA